MLDKTKVFGYVRVSSQGQADGDGPERQEIAIRMYASMHGMTVEHIYQDAHTGTSESRPALAEMLVSIAENGHGINTVIIEKMDRLARDLMVQEIIVADLKKQGCNLISVHEGPDMLSDNPTRLLIRQIMGAFAQYEKSMIVSKLKVARERQRAKNGKCEGRKSWEESAPDVPDLIISLRQSGMTWTNILKELNKRGMKNQRGKPFKLSAIQMVYYKRMGKEGGTPVSVQSGKKIRRSS